MIVGRLQVPPNVRRGEAFQVRILIQHAMETGYRRDMDGRAIALNVVDSVVCRYAGREILRAQLGTGIAANPYIAFHAMAGTSGEIEVEFRDDRGEQGRLSATLTVT
jgi:sulfur-oxidizing protein SoxZ